MTRESDDVRYLKRRAVPARSDMKLLLLALCCLPMFGESLQLDQEVTAESGLSVLVMRQVGYPLPVLGMPPGRRGVMILIKNDTADVETTYFQVSVQRSDGRPMTALFRDRLSRTARGWCGRIRMR